MADKLTSGAVVYRSKGNSVQWFVLKPKDGSYELPKVQVRPGESSVQAILRFLRENTGLKVTVLEEAGRTRAKVSVNGKIQAVQLIFYLLKGDDSEEAGPVFIEGEWMPYTKIRRKLTLVREQKILSQANATLREWRKKRRQTLG